MRPAILGAVTAKLYKAADVCETIGLQAYVLRSWEKEFPSIGVQKSEDSPRLYRQSDIEQVLRIRQLVFGEGLTLAGARRRIEGTPSPASNAREAEAAEMAEVLSTLGADAQARIALVRRGLRSILDVLSKTPGSTELAELRRAAPAVGRGGRPPGSGRDGGRPSGPSKARSKPRPQAARGKSSPSKRMVAVKRGAKRKRAGA